MVAVAGMIAKRDIDRVTRRDCHADPILKQGLARRLPQQKLVTSHPQRLACRHHKYGNMGGGGHRGYFSGIKPRGEKRRTSKRINPIENSRICAAESNRWAFSADPSAMPEVTTDISQ